VTEATGQVRRIKRQVTKSGLEKTPGSTSSEGKTWVFGGNVSGTGFSVNDGGRRGNGQDSLNPTDSPADGGKEKILMGGGGYHENAPKK